MPTIREIIRRKREAKAAPTLEQLQALNQPSFTDQALNTLLTPLRLFGEAVETVDAPTRAAVAGALEALGRTPIERTGRETIFGQAPTGRELIGLGTGEKGTFESGDIPGFLAEAAVSPLNFLSALKLTRAGELASRATELAGKAKNLRAAGVLDSATRKELLPILRSLRGQARELGVSRRLGNTLGEQARLGQRSLLSFDPLFTGGRINAPLTPRFLNEPALRGLGAIGGLARGSLPGRAASSVYRELFAPGGRTGDKAYDQLIDLRQQLVREGRRLGQEEFHESLKFLKKSDATKAERALASLAAQSEAPLREAIQAIEKPFRDQIDRALKADQIGKADRLTARMEKATAKLRNFVPTQTDATRAILQMGLHERDVAARTVKEIEGIQKAASKTEADLIAAKTAAAISGATPVELGRIQARLTRLRNRTAQKVLVLQKHGEVADAVMAALPPDFQQEVNRVGLLLGSTLNIEQAAGVRVSDLIDPLLSYVPRIPTRAGLDWARTRRFDDPFTHFARVYSTNEPFTKQRVAAFRGLSITQINDLAREMGFKGDFFTEDVGEAVLRRLTDSGRARGTAHMMQGIAQMFSLPGDTAKGAGMAVHDFLRRANLTRVGGILGLETGEDAVKKALKGTKFEGAVIPYDIAEKALTLNRVMEHGPALTKMLRFVDKAHSLSRFAVTQFFPSYHARNKVSNWTMMYLAGMRNPIWIARGQRLAYRVQRGVESDLERKTWQEAIDYGAVKSSISAETLTLGKATEIAGSSISEGPGVLQRYLSDPLKRATGGKVDLSAIPRSALKFGALIEDSDKVAMYLWARHKGLGRFEAGNLVKKFLFDYEDLSRFEKDTLRRAAFFFTYSRKIIPLLLEQLFTNPRSMRLYGLVTGEIGDQGERARLMPAWLRDRQPFDFGMDDNGNRVFVSAGLPMEELNFLSPEGGGIRTVGRKLLNRLAPIPRAIIEEGTGTDLLRGRPLRGIQPDRDLSAGLPEGVRREAAPLILLERLAPSSRFTSVLRGGLEALRSEEPARGRDYLAQLAGLSVRRLNPQTAELQTRLDLANKALERADQIGDQDRAKLLRSGIARLRRDLSNQK